MTRSRELLRPLRAGCIWRTSICLQSDEASGWARKLAPLASPGGGIFTMRFAVVDDETVALLWETATHVDVRVRLDEKARTVARGALWLEKSLPPRSLLIGLLTANRGRRSGVAMSPEQVLDFAVAREEVDQLGGEATTGRGRSGSSPLRERTQGMARADARDKPLFRDQRRALDADDLAGKVLPEKQKY